ncbi:M28 family peptidase [Mesonia ostreae]|uniref:Vacuolar membrane protease n=1 Tax=Mesonia ostreae TaxID=861110 RepID=A0ABU2KII8_9FLAO|nr:M28 family peptidase [Mesonia ostreae]MDT0294528.1 M28 family peptidase [Mesonia ostreae]
MKTTISSILVLLFLALISYFSIVGLQPSATYFEDHKDTSFSTSNALTHVKKIANQPHAIGTKAHSKVRNYIVQQLQDLDLAVQTQKGYDFNNYGVITAPENIIAKIEGTHPNRPALLVMTHYDSAVHSSRGASDAASGVGVILEILRVFLAENTPPKNDVIICFTDGEEVGLSGAGLFVKEHPWAKNIGLVLNFEARGSGGPSNTILETNSGNSNLIKAFAEANPRFPVATSLMYSVYKKLPNDTDATVFREVNNTPSFFFAFIDDHFDYHTARDTPQNLDTASLVHQATYLQALLPYFSQLDLNTLHAERDEVYFNFFGLDLVHYPFAWIIPMLILAWLLFLGFFLYGTRKKLFILSEVTKGFLPLLKSLFFGILTTYALTYLLPKMYDSVLENQNDFPFNGHLYIAVGVALTLAFLLYFYRKYTFKTPEANKGVMVSFLLLWLIILTLIAFVLKGAAYFMIPFFFSLASFVLLLFNQRNPFIHLVLGIPALVLLVPLVQFFPIGLGLSKLFISALFVVLIFGLIWPVMASLKFKKVGVVIFGLLAVVLIIAAHTKADFSSESPKPNSLVYLLDTDTQKASWHTYDLILDAYTKPYFTEKSIQNDSVIFDSKYQSQFTYSAAAPTIEISEAETQVEILNKNKTFTEYEVKISPQREVNRMEIFLDQQEIIEDLQVNGKSTPAQQMPFYKNRNSNKLLTYFAVDRDTLRLKLKLKSTVSTPILQVYEASYDLLDHKTLDIVPRNEKMMPRPFVLNDVIITKQKIRLE